MITRNVFLLVTIATTACSHAAMQRETTVSPHRSMTVPRAFERNDGQAPPEYRYLGRAGTYDLAFADDHVTIALKDHEATSQVALRFLESSSPKPLGTRPLAGRVNYLRGRNPDQWQRNVPTYAAVRYQQLYTGVDAVFYPSDRAFEYDLVVAPHADPSRIAIAFDGSSKVKLDSSGNLVLEAGGRRMIQRKPTAYQEVRGHRVSVDARYRLSEGRVTFVLGQYDSAEPLTLDPVIASSSIFGGGDFDFVEGIGADASGAVYIAGATFSTNFPASAGSHHNAAAGTGDAFVCKLTPKGDAIVYCTEFGGGGNDVAWGVAVDAGGHAYAAGSTNASDFPTTAGSLQPACDHCGSTTPDAFVVKLAADGASFVYSTFLGGTGDDSAMGIGVDASGRAHVGGATASADFPVTPAAAQQHYAGGGDAFVATIAADGASAVFASYLGGSGKETPQSVAIDAGGNTYIAGSTNSSNLPVMAALQPSLTFVPGNPPNQDGFFARFSPSGALTLSSYFGGGNDDTVFSIAADTTGVYLGGQTSSPTLPPMTSGSRPQGEAAFLTQLTPDGMHAKVTQFFDGTGDDQVLGIAVDGSTVHAVGYSTSRNFPTTASAPQPAPLSDPSGGAAQTAFYLTLPIDASGTMAVSPSFSTYLGGSLDSTARAVTADGNGGAFVGGFTTSKDFPAVNAAHRFAASNDGWVVHVVPDAKFVNSVAGDRVAYVADTGKIVGSAWQIVADPSAAGGRRAFNPDAGVAKIVTPAANPASYVELTFNADAGVAYRLWVRGKAQKDLVSNDSVYTQFSDSVDAGGSPMWRIGTTSATTVILEDCTNCGDKGWEWQDNGYGTNVLGPVVRFATTGAHTIRFQQREDGISIDHIVLSSGTYLSTPPGAPFDTTVVLPRSSATAPPPPPPDTCTTGEVVLYASNAQTTGHWNIAGDTTAAGGRVVVNPDAGAAKLAAPPAPPQNYFDLTFTADADVDYHLWIRGKAQSNFWGNDSVFVQFSGAVDASHQPLWSINSTSATDVNLEDCSGCGEHGWGWQDNGYGKGVAGPAFRFGVRGDHIIRVMTREDGLSIDQIVISSGTYRSKSPGALKDDTTILPQCATPPLR
jgi:Beta-propeller repeat